jgi:hypothetical protein
MPGSFRLVLFLSVGKIRKFFRAESPLYPSPGQRPGFLMMSAGNFRQLSPRGESLPEISVLARYEAIQGVPGLDCFASLARTIEMYLQPDAPRPDNPENICRFLYMPLVVETNLYFCKLIAKT